jgi:hypothetical protein
MMGRPRHRLGAGVARLLKSAARRSTAAGEEWRIPVCAGIDITDCKRQGVIANSRQQAEPSGEEHALQSLAVPTLHTASSLSMVSMRSNAPGGPSAPTWTVRPSASKSARELSRYLRFRNREMRSAIEMCRPTTVLPAAVAFQRADFVHYLSK